MGQLLDRPGKGGSVVGFFEELPHSL